mgnify:CR=1 FL=1
MLVNSAGNGGSSKDVFNGVATSLTVPSQDEMRWSSPNEVQLRMINHKITLICLPIFVHAQGAPFTVANDGLTAVVSSAAIIMGY